MSGRSLFTECDPVLNGGVTDLLDLGDRPAASFFNLSFFRRKCSSFISGKKLLSNNLYK